MKVNDILGIGKILPIDKLIDVMSSVTGRVTKPYFDRKDIDTKAYEIKKLAEAKAEEMKIIANAVKENFQLTGGIEYKEEKLIISSAKELPIENKQTIIINPPLEERTNERLNYQEAKKQLNIESVTTFAADELRNEQSVTDEPLDEDWKTRFFNIAEDISNEEMQSLWGRILAGEIKQPKSYSLRTLELLKNLSKEEAEVFAKFAQLRINSGDKNIIYNQDNGVFLESEFGITFSDRLLLTELGLIASENNLEFSLQPTDINKLSNILNYGRKGIVLYRNEQTPKQGIEVLVFTKIGVELSALIEQTFNLNYIEKICSSFKHPNVKIEYGDLVSQPNGQLMLFNKVEYNK
ncbi:MAG: DUF2806 domain-containing protein [Bacteroidia bacterium]|nr:DUF2806 domain-containing protein [Bacteroidia bacterium]